MKKRCLALLTLLVMLASVLPGTAMAEEAFMFHSTIGNRIKDTEVLVPSEYHLSDKRTHTMSGWVNYISYMVDDPSWDVSRIYTSGEYTYYLLDDDTIALIALDQTYQSKKVVIPQTIDGHTVSRFGLDRNVAAMKVDYRNSSHDSWTILDEQLLLGENVEELILPESVEVIGCASLWTSTYSTIKKLTAPGVKEYGGVIVDAVYYSLPAKVEKSAGLPIAIRVFIFAKTS